MNFEELKRLVDDAPDSRVVFVENGEPALIAEKPGRSVYSHTTPRTNTSMVHPNVHLGKNVVIEDFCVIGAPPRGTASGELATVIGDNSVIRSHTVIYAGNQIGDNFHVGHHALIREQNMIGSSVSVGSFTNIEHHVRIADNVRIHSRAFIPEYSELQEHAWIGPGVIMTNAAFPRSARVKEQLIGPLIEPGAKVGAGSVLLPGVKIGTGSLVGAGSVVTKDVPEGTVVVGTPAQATKQVADLRYKDTGEAAYPSSAISPQASPIPLVDLKAQYRAIKGDIDAAITRVIESTAFIQGEEVKKFEQEFAAYCGAKHCVGVANGTVAIQLVLRALGIGHGDEVITTPMTFIATSEAIINAGASVVFVDIDEHTYTLDPKKLEAAITPKTRAIIPVHLYGQPADMLSILEIAHRHNLLVIEDCAQAHGATAAGRHVPLTIGTFSFYPGKNLGAYGDAGAVVLNDDALAQAISQLRDHGRSTKYEHHLTGTNARMDGIQGAILRAKLPYLPDWTVRRRAIAERYRAVLSGLPLVVPFEDSRGMHVYHLFVIRTPP